MKIPAKEMFVLAALAAAVPRPGLAREPDACRPLVPRDYDGRIALRLTDTLQKAHVLHKRLDDEISRRAWTNLVTFYDSDHSVFLKGDLDALAVRERRLDDEIKKGDVSFGYDVYNLYVRRLRERIDFATNLVLTADWDFTTNETYRIRRKDAPWPATRADAEEHWRKRLKNECLVAKVNHDLDKSTNALNVAADLVKRYRQYAITLTEPDEEAVFQHYMSAIARAYDPHSDYMSPASKEDFDMEMNLTLCGVGAVLSMEDGALKITEVMPGGPMDVDGRIKEGDKIVGVRQSDGEMEDIMWQPMRKSIKKIRGKKGTRVTLEIVPRSDSSGLVKKQIELVRDEIKLEDQASTGRWTGSPSTRATAARRWTSRGSSRTSTRRTSRASSSTCAATAAAPSARPCSCRRCSFRTAPSCRSETSAPSAACRFPRGTPSRSSARWSS